MAAIVQQRAESDSSNFELQREVRLSDTGGEVRTKERVANVRGSNVLSILS